MYKKLYLENYLSDRVRTYWQSSVVTLTFGPSLAILHLCMIYESYMLKTTWVIVSEPKCWQSSILTLDPIIHTNLPHHLASILNLNFKVVHSKLFKLSCLNQSVDKVLLWTYSRYRVGTKVSSYLVRTKVLTKFGCDLTILHLCMKYVRWKLLKFSCQNQSVDKVLLWPWPYDLKMYGYLPFTAYMYEIWRLYVENHSSHRVRTKMLTETDGQRWFQ